MDDSFTQFVTPVGNDDIAATEEEEDTYSLESRLYAPFSTLSRL